MIHNLFSVYDTVAKAYMQPFFTINRGTAVRAITGALQDAQHPFAKEPHSYLLYHLGNFDDASGSFEIGAQPENLGPLSQFLPE